MNSARQAWTEVLVFCFTAVFVFLVGFAAGAFTALKDSRIEAVKKGHAVWIVDEEGYTRFQWKEAKP